ncbi:MAG TPA: 50S ribosomal protein L10 [Phycisphaerae bacterium]|nr:50S ribosomal protein L10 [Phycisphaerae bacterium]
MSRRVKDLTTEELRSRYEGVDSVLLVDPTGIDANMNNALRGDLRSKSVRLQVVKNSLARRAFAGGPLEPMGPLLEGPNALVTGGDSIVDAAKVVADWGKKKVGLLKIRGAMVEGEVLGAAEASELAKMPGRRELHQQVVGLSLSPGARLVGALMGPAGVIAGCLRAIIEKAEAA